MTTAQLESTPATVLWGRLPCEIDRCVLTVGSGDTVVVDTVSHEGIMADQGRDPVAFFAGFGVEAAEVDPHAISIAAHVPRMDGDGPHVVTGPIRVEGARPGDRLAVTVLKLEPRVSYGIVSSRHSKGLLPAAFPRRLGVESIFCHVEGLENGFDAAFGTLPLRADSTTRPVRFPLAPFLGMMGVVTAGHLRPHSTPPGLNGGNIDVPLFGVGSTIFFPVEVEGAGLYVGDPHFAQGNGEIALTALEAPLRATLQLRVIPAVEADRQFGSVLGPFGVTRDFLVPLGLDVDLDVAVAKCAENALELLSAVFGMQRELGYAYMSAATDFDISQVVDVVKGVHARIRLADFAALGDLPHEVWHATQQGHD